MHSFSKLLVLGTFSVAVVASPAIYNRNLPVGKAIYITTNEKANAVVAVPIDSNGMLSQGKSFSTGGAGSNSINGNTKGPASPDPLVSQSALTVAGHSLFAVNAGSNTITMFMIDQFDPTKLTMVGKPVAVPGEFPNTVAASQKHKLVCVGTSGAKAGISCASFSHKGVGTLDALRPFDLKQTTPPVGPLNTVSHAFFSSDESTLFTTVKGDPTKMIPGFLAAYGVDSCSSGTTVSQSGVESTPNGTAVLFGSAPIPNSNDLFVTDASFGGAVLSVDPHTKMASVKGKVAITGQKATCWSTISPATNTAFVTDVARDILVEMSLTDASIKSTIDLSANGDPGLIDLRAAGRFVYALSPGNGTTQSAVAVVDAIGKKQVQHFGLMSLGVGKNAQGMAILI